MDGGETKKSAPSYFVIKVNDDGTITQTRQQGTLTTKPHIIRTPEKRTKDGRTIYIEQKDNLGSSTIKIHEPVGTSEASMMSNILVEAEPTGKSTRPTIQSKVTAKQATLVRKSLGLPKINVPSKLVLVKPGMGVQSTTTSGPQIIKIQPQTSMVKHTAILPKQSRKTPLTARATDDAIVMEGEAERLGSGIIIQVAPAAGGVTQRIKIPPQKMTVMTSPKKTTKVEQVPAKLPAKVQIIKTVQEIKPKVTPVMRQVVKTTVPISSTTTSVPIPLPIKGTTSPVKVVIVKEGMQPKPIAPKPAPMTISLVPPPISKTTVVSSSSSSPIKIAPAPGPGTMTAQRVVQIVPSVKKTMGPVIKLPEKPKPIAPAAELPKPLAPVVAAPKGRGRGRGKAVAAQTKEAPVKIPGKLAAEEAKESKEMPASPAKTAPPVEAEKKEEAKKPEPAAKPVGRRGAKKGGKTAPEPEKEEEEPPVVEQPLPAPAPVPPKRGAGRPKKIVAPEPAKVQKVESEPDKPKSPVAPVAAPRGRGRVAKKAAEPEKVAETPAKKAKIEEKKQPEKKQPASEPEPIEESKPAPEKKVAEAPKKKGKPPAAKKEEKKEAQAAPESAKKAAASKQIPEDKGYLFSRPVPIGWSRDVIQRKAGKTAGKHDVYVFSPDGLKHRSRNDIQRYLILNKDQYPGLKPDDFDFSVAKETKSTPSTSKAQPKVSEVKEQVPKGKKAPAKKVAKRQGPILVVSLPPKRTRK